MHTGSSQDPKCRVTAPSLITVYEAGEGIGDRKVICDHFQDFDRKCVNYITNTSQFSLSLVSLTNDFRETHF